MASHDDICSYLNGKTFSSLNPNMQNFITYITGGITGNPLISCIVIDNNLIKPNLDIEINSTHYYISTLDGEGNSVHEEQPHDIENFLRTLGAPDDVITCIHDLCYSTNHTTGFINSDLITNPTRIPLTRQFFHANRTIFIDRALRTGIYGGQPTQFVYWGNVSYGLIENINTVISTLSGYVANTGLIAIGGLVLQRKDRFVNHNIQLKWPHPANDL